MDPRLAKRWLRENRVKQPRSPLPFPSALPPKPSPAPRALERKDFLGHLTQVLDQIGPLARYQVTEANELIRSHRREYPRISAVESAALPRRGLCLECQRGPIAYHPELCSPHRNLGEVWREELFESWTRPATVVDGAGSEPKPHIVNGMSWDLVQPYLCGTCQERFARPSCVRYEEQELQRQQAATRQILQELRILHGQVPASWEQQWKALHAFLSPLNLNQLRTCPYELFRQTRYWELVRTWVVRGVKSKCQQCKRRRAVEVYHRDGQGQGYELESESGYRLAVLCAECGPVWATPRVVASMEEWKQHLPGAGPVGPSVALRKRWAQSTRLSAKRA